MISFIKKFSFKLLVIAPLTALCLGATFEASPPLKEDAIPEPPMQHAAWSPEKAELPADLLSATKRLFEQGLGDPRGCEYREVSVGTGTCWSGDGGVVQCHGWVLPLPPAADAAAQRFAVCWNGLVYPAVSVGEKTDLEAGIDAVIRSDDAAKAAAARRNPKFPFHRSRSNCPAEGNSISEKTMLPIKVCMLLRLGKGDLAARVWKSWNVPGGAANGGAANQPDPYPELSGALEWALFDRAVCGHMRGDDRLSLLAGKALTTLRKSVDDEIAARKITADRLGVSYLDVLPSLVEDEERRLKQRPRTAALKLGEKSFANKAAWVSALIADLDQVNARQMGQPGGVGLGDDPIIQTLIACGDDAVDPLLVCLEHDTRLTRSVHFWRDFSASRNPIGVPEAAYVALSGILQTSFFSVGFTGDDLSAHGQEGRTKVAAAIRAYWSKYKGLTSTERWFAILADDQAGAAQWMQAMSNITRPVDVRVSPGSMFRTAWVTMPSRMPGQQPKLSGEGLRTKHDPSLLDLAAKRIDQIDRLDAAGSSPAVQAAAASDMAMQLFEWDPAGSKPVLRRQLDYCMGLFSHIFFPTNGESLCPRIARLAEAMASAGDPSGLKTYGDWLHRSSPPDLGPNPDQVLSPLWKFQDDPAIIATADWLFNDPNSRWNPMLPKLNAGWGQETLLESPLLALRPFRDQMLRGLADQSPYATLVMHDGRDAELKVDRGSRRLIVPSGDPVIAPAGTEMTIRTCDRYAYEMSHRPGAPCIQFYWPLEQRDAAVKACAEFLTQFGGDFRYSTAYSVEDAFAFRETAHLTFPPLDHPATTQEANTARAIFSLEGEGERRLFKLPKVPAKAKWVTLKKYPLDQERYDPAKGESRVSHVFEQDSWVWQAEEVKVQGQWQRYFGVVGPHEVARVAASEIEFDSRWPWTSLSNGVDCKIDAPGYDTQDGNVTVTALTPESPLIVRVTFLNRRGVAQSLPAKYIAKADGGKLMIRPGIIISLEKLPDDNGSRVEPGPGTKMPAKSLPPLDADLANQRKLVESTDTFSAAEFDLRDCFDATRPGAYRLQIQFTQESGVGEGGPLSRWSSA